MTTPEEIEAVKREIVVGLQREGDADIRAGLAYLSDEALNRIAKAVLAAAEAERFPHIKC